MSNNNVCDCQNKKKSYPTWSSNSELPHSNGPFITMSKAYFCYECSTLNIYNLHIEFDTHIYIYIYRTTKVIQWNSYSYAPEPQPHFKLLI